MHHAPRRRVAGAPFRLSAAAALVATLACAASELLGPDAPQGIDGIALKGPTCPVQEVGQPCADRPHQARIEIETARGSFVTEVRTGEDGRFRVGLAPGDYVLLPEDGDPFPVADEVEVTVAPGRYTEVVISYDTGIR